MSTQKTGIYIRFGADAKALIQNLATSLGVSQADYVRYTIKQDLKERGLLQEATVLRI